MSKRKIRDAVAILDRKYGGDPEWNQMVLEEELNGRIAQLIYAFRQHAELTQSQLAEMIGVQQPLISKLENASYEGSAVEMLLRVCFALHRRVEITCPNEQKPLCRISLVPA